MPYNLYGNSSYGISWYVLRNRISVQDQNWIIDTDLIDESRAMPMRWAAIRAFLPLDEDEAKEAVAELNKTLREQMPKGVVKPRRIYESTELHLCEVVEMLNTEKEVAGDRIAQTNRETKLLEGADDLAIDLFGYSIRPDSNGRH